MVPKESGFNQSKTSCALCARTLSRFPGSTVIARDSEVLQRQHICHHGYTICHPKSGYVTTKLHGTSTCGCNNKRRRSTQLDACFFSTGQLCNVMIF